MSKRIMLFVGVPIGWLSLFAMLAQPTWAAIDVEHLKQREQQVQDLVQKVLPCTVCLRSPNGQGSGSGVIVSADGLILTAGHVTAATGKDLIIIFPDGRKVKGKSLGANRGRDAGMAKIVDEGQYEFVEIGKSADLKKNHWCVALGHAGGFDAKRTPPVRIGRIIANQHFLVSDCTLIGGDSGGPLFDLEGRLIGIHSNIGASLTQNQHVPIAVFHEDWQRMKKGETWGSMRGGPPSPNQAVLGVQLNPQPIEGGVGLIAVVPNSPAAKAGLLAEDIIIQVDGTKTAAMADVIKQVRKKKPGQKVALKVKRGDQTLDFSIKLVRAADLRPKTDPAKPKTDADKSADDDKPASDADAAENEADGGAKADEDTAPDTAPDTNDSSVETPADEKPADEKPADEKPDDEKPDDEQPDDEQPEDEKPADKQPADQNADQPKGPRSVQDLLKEARKNGGRLQLTPEEMRRLQQHMAKRMGRGGFRPPVSTGKDEWFEEMINAYVPIVAQASSSTYRVLVDGKKTALATAMTDHTLLTKASEIDDKSFEIEIAKDEVLVGSVVKLFPAYDLALVSVGKNILTPAQLHTENIEYPLGTFVAAADEEAGPSAIGVISVESRSLKQAKRGYLGVGLKPSDDGVSLGQILPKSPAKKAGLKVGDVIVTIDDKKVASAAALSNIIGGHKPGDHVVFQVRRGDQELSVRVKLADRSSAAAMKQSRLEKMNRMGGQLSETRSGFPLALQHDCPLPPADCGGPLVNLDGQVIGINIARAGRIKSYAVPADVIQELLKTVPAKSKQVPVEAEQPVLDSLEPAEPTIN